jgi:enoyl-CoA hydratase/carnithine racemase
MADSGGVEPSGFETITYAKQDDTAVVTLNRPRVLNAYNLRMRDELFEVLGAIRDDDEVRVLVLRGAGRAFCAGADLTEFGTAPSPTVARRIRYARDVWHELDALDVPRIAALHGFAFGSGLELALFCDFRIAAEGTQFGFPEVKLGFIPAAGGTQMLPRTIGPARAMEMLLGGKNLSTDEALAAGLITRTTPADGLDQEWQQMAADLARLDRMAVRAMLHAVRHGSDLPLEAAVELEAHLAARLRHPPVND